jgi:Kef-type K+ transport system membrane component KefB
LAAVALGQAPAVPKPNGSGNPLLGVFLVFLVGMVGAEVAQRLRQPAVVGQLVAGAVFGPSALAWIRPTESLSLLASIGTVLLLFDVGLELEAGHLRRLGRVSAQVAVLGVVVPCILGFGWALASGYEARRAAFVASAFAATSAGS